MSERFWLRVAVVLGVVSWFFLSACADAAPRPFTSAEPERTAVVAVHGGGWFSGTPASAQPLCDQVAVPLGFDCFTPSYTLSGAAPFNAANADLAAYVTDLRTQGYERIIGVGSSAGGNLVAWLAAKGHLDAAVTLSAPTKLTTLADWYRAGCECWVVDQFAPTTLKKTNASPAFDVIDVPILILHAENEPQIPQLQAYKLAEVSPLSTLVILSDDTRHAMAYFADEASVIAEWIGALP